MLRTFDLHSEDPGFKSWLDLTSITTQHILSAVILSSAASSLGESTSVSKLNPNLAASNTTAAIVRQKLEAATLMASAYSSPVPVPEGNMSPISEVSSVPTSLSLPVVQSASPRHVSVIHKYRKFKGTETCGHAMIGKGTSLKTSIFPNE